MSRGDPLEPGLAGDASARAPQGDGAGDAHAASPPLLTSRQLGRVPGVVHGFTTRVGGVSPPPWESLNLGLGTSDDSDHVRENRDRVVAALGVQGGRWISQRQVHGEQVVEVVQGEGGDREADGAWTRVPKTVLATLTADCVPVLIAAADGSVVAAVHAGWRGTVLRIAQTTVETLVRESGIDAAELVAAIGPAIGPCCFEIGGDTATALRSAFPKHGDVCLRAAAEGGDRSMADLWELNRISLCEAGMADSAIDVLRTCTVCTPTLFSHRRDHGMTGRQAGVIARL